LPDAAANGLENDTASLRQEAAALEKNAAVLNKEAADARLNLAELEAPRVVTPAQQQIIVATLKDAPKGPVSVIYPITDNTDAKDFADSITRTLARAGDRIVPPEGKLQAILSWSSPGAYLVVHNIKRAPRYAGAIQHAFGRAGIYLIGTEKPDDVGPAQVIIVVSSHPFDVQQIPKQLRAGKP
jgi:hypothetical protein